MVKKIIERINKIDNVEKSGLLNMIIKPISLFLTFIYVPILLRYLGTEKYGLWATILSIISWINYFDVGIGNGLRNVLTKDIFLRNYEHAKKSVSTAYFLLSGISFSILIILIISVFTFNWFDIFSTKVDMRLTLGITFIFICINFVLSIANVILYALQMAEKVSLRSCSIQILNIVGVLLIGNKGEGSLVFISILFGGTTFFINFFTTVQIFRKNKYLTPSITCIDKTCIADVCGMGLQFFIIQIMCLLMFTVDNLLISHYFGAESVTPFSVVNKVYNAGYSVLAAFMVPYWSGTTAAIERNDIGWIRKSIKKTMHIFGVYILGCVFLSFIFKPIASVWLQKNLEYEPGIVGLMCVFYILFAALNIECQFINGSGQLKTQMIVYIIVGIMNVPLSIYLGVFLNLRSFGIRLGTTILVLVATIVLAIDLANILKKMENETTITKTLHL